MDNNSNVFKIRLQSDYSLKIELGEYEKLAALGELSRCIDKNEQIQKWMDNESVPKAEKEKYEPMFVSLLRSISYLHDFLIRAGVSKEEIEENVKLPF